MEEIREVEGIAGFSVKAFLLTTLGIIMLGMYVKVLIFGENSLTVLNTLTKRKEGLIQEKKVLKVENQRLQKKFFELKQLESKELI